MSEQISHAEFKKSLLQDEDVKDAYDDLGSEYSLIRQMLKIRKKKGLSQSDVAKTMYTTPSVISRLESMHVDGRPSPSLETLQKYAHARGCKLDIKFISRD